jgi:hypothetical protein
VYLLKKQTRRYEDDLSKIQNELDLMNKPLKKMTAISNILSPSKGEIEKIMSKSNENKLKEEIRFLKKLPNREDVSLKLKFLSLLNGFFF